MLLAGKKNIDELKANNFDIEYHKIQEYDSWKINFVQELVELRYGDLHVPGMTTEELQQILEHLCSNWWPSPPFHWFFIRLRPFSILSLVLPIKKNLKYS